MPLRNSFVRAVTLNPELDKAQIELGNLYLGDYLIETTKNPLVHKKISTIADRLLGKYPQSFAGLIGLLMAGTAAFRNCR